MPINRQIFCSESNNTDDPKKNLCALKVAEFLRCGNRTKYLHTLEDILIAIRRGSWTARSRKCYLGKKKNTSELLKKCPKITAKDKKPIKYYIVQVESHVFLVDATGRTVVDSAPEHSKNMEIINFYAVY